MNLASAQIQLQLAQQTTFRDEYKVFSGGLTPTLNNEAIVLVFAVAKEKITTIPGIAAKLPEACKDHFKKLRRMENSEEEPFFERFVLFAKTPNDGILVGFGVDEFYYVVATWDQNGADLWQPEQVLLDVSCHG